MRKSYLLSGALTVLTAMGISCSDIHYGNDTQITISESDDVFKMSAFFDRNNTTKVRRYMDQHLRHHANMSFEHAEVDANLTLDDNTNFYIKSQPGALRIRIDKHSNSERSYNEVKEMCQGIKAMIEKE